MTTMLDDHKDLPVVHMRPIFVEVLPLFEMIKDGEMWISHKHRTVNLRCPCGCGELAVLSLHPTRWHVYFDGKSVSLKGPTGGSIWTSSACGSHYHVRENEVVWSHPIDPRLRPVYRNVERARMVEASHSRRTFRSLFGRLWAALAPSWLRW